MTARDQTGQKPAIVPSRLKKRADFVAASKGRRFHAGGFTLQSAKRSVAAPDVARIGLTVTKKTGNSVVRNRIRRRLREALRTGAGAATDPSHDYVIVARRELLSANFAALGAGLAAAFQKIHSPRPPRGSRAN